MLAPRFSWEDLNEAVTRDRRRISNEAREVLAAVAAVKSAEIATKVSKSEELASNTGGNLLRAVPAGLGVSSFHCSQNT